MSKQNTKATIDANIKQNGRQAITGQILNGVLNTMVNDYAEESRLETLEQGLSIALPTLQGELDSTKGRVTTAEGNITEQGAKLTDLERKTEELDKGVFGNFTKNLTWSNGYINTDGIINPSSLSRFSQPALLKKGETIKVGTQNTNITIIGKVDSIDPLNIGDTITPIRITSSASRFEEYSFTAEEDCYVVACVLWSNHTIEFTAEPLVASKEDLSTKVDKEVGKTLLDSNVAESLSCSFDPDYVYVIVDNRKNIVGAIDKKGNLHVIGNVLQDGSSTSTTEHFEFIDAKIDKDGKVLEALKVDGTKVLGEIESPTIERLSNSVEELSEVVAVGAYGRVKDSEPAIAAACRLRKSSDSSQDLCIIEITDSHSDDQAVANAANIASGFQNIDALIHCGDIEASYWGNSNLNTFAELMQSANKPYYVVIGNHEAGTFNPIYCNPTQQEMYDALIAPIVEKGYLRSGEYTQGKCYYYHDFTDRNVRLIVLNEYEWLEFGAKFNNTYWHEIPYDANIATFREGTTYTVGQKVNSPNYTGHSFECTSTVTVKNLYTDQTTQPCYYGRGGDRCVTKEQLLWLCNTLNTTPANYGVVIALHNPFSPNAKTDKTKKFCEDVDWVGMSQIQSVVSNDVFADIVNAFINKEAYHDKIVFSGWGTYLNTLNDGVNNYAYEINFDFSGRNNTSKFIAYIGGHVHRDSVWYHPTYAKQWQVTPICANTINYAQSPSSDIRRSALDGFAKDSLTCIGFDKDNMILRLVKLGVDVTENMVKRDYESIKLI